MRSYREWAELIASRLSDAELDEFTLSIDSDVNDVFYQHVNEINVKRNPTSYASIPADEKERKQ